MNYEHLSTQRDQLAFTLELVKRCIPVQLIHVTKEDTNELLFQKLFQTERFAEEQFEQYLLQYCKQNTDTKITTVITSFHLNYSVLCLNKSEQEYLIFGPYLDHTMSDSMVYEIVKQHNLTLENASQLKGYYQSLPIYDISHIVGICETIRQNLIPQNSYIQNTVIDFRKSDVSEELAKYMQEEFEQHTFYRELERRYEHEEQVLHAIAQGDYIKAQHIWKTFSSELNSIQRTKDPLRNGKNLLLIANTLYRKAAQQGGVHPIYLDELSSKWALRIEHCNTKETLETMIGQMLRSYCLLVKTHSLAHYSPIVKRAVTFINLNLANPLTVTEVADEVCVSPDYLTRLFKKELSMPVITYINKQRIDTSIRLLNTTSLSIQDIGDMVGINDTCYFNKLFKKCIGMSPKQYRESIHH